jgi:hypothetical protein
MIYRARPATFWNFTNGGDFKVVEINWDIKAFLENVTSEAYRRLLNAAEALQTNARRLCPVRTGRLRDSITVAGNGTDSVSVGTDVPYALSVELGHVRRLEDGSEKHVPAEPFLIPAFEEIEAAIRDQGLEAFE